MKRATAIVGFIALACALVDVAHAAQRTFVASNGNDAAACSLGAPCRGFAAAIAKADAGGEVIVLDSAGYGVATITKSVSIIAPPGVYAGISAASGNGITINGTGIDVVLRGLAINGAGGGAEGIAYVSGATLTVDRCIVTNFTSNGLRLQSDGAVSVADSAFVSNGVDGISVEAASLTVQIDRTRMEANIANGVRIQAAAKVTLNDSLIARNGGGGANVFIAGAFTAKLAIDRSTIVDNAFTAVIANATASGAIVHLDVTRSTIARNGAGILALASVGATARVGATNNEVTDNNGNGITASGAGGSVRASGNKVMRNTGGLVQQSGGIVYTPATNYVRDNTTNDGGHTADTRL